MGRKYLMALDAGTGAGRCSIFDLEGNTIGADYCEWKYDTPYENKQIREFDPEAFWKIFCKVIKGAVQKAGIDVRQIIGISSTSQREGIVAIDKDGKEIYAAPNIDFRGQDQADWLKNNYGNYIYNISGHWPDALNAISRILWFKEHCPQIYEKMHKIMMINDWILYRLTGEIASEPTNACETLFFNIKDMKWDFYLMDKIGIKKNLLPRVRRSGEFLGKVNDLAASQTGLCKGTPVFVGAADTQCAVLGTGGFDEGHIVIVSGTSTPIQAVVDKPIIDPKKRVRTCCYITGNKWVLDSNARPTGVVYRWIRDTLYSYCGEKRSDKLYEIMNKEAEDVEPGCGGLMAFMGPSILNVSNQRDFPNMFIGLKPGYERELCKRGLFARSILENIAFAIKGNLEQIYDIIGYPSKKIYITGGGAKAAIFLEITANVLGIPINIAECSEATSLGAAICASVGSGAYSGFEDAVKAMVKKSSFRKIKPSLVKEYKNYYSKWKRIYDFMTENIEFLV